MDNAVWGYRKIESLGCFHKVITELLVTYCTPCLWASTGSSIEILNPKLVFTHMYMGFVYFFTDPHFRTQGWNWTHNWSGVKVWQSCSKPQNPASLPNGWYKPTTPMSKVGSLAPYHWKHPSSPRLVLNPQLVCQRFNSFVYLTRIFNS